MRVAILILAGFVNGAPAIAEMAPEEATVATRVALADTTLLAQNNAGRGSTEAFQATSRPPWNPPQAVASRPMWEQVVLFPGAVVSLPLKVLGMATDHGLLYLEEHALVTRAGAVGQSDPDRIGLTLGAGRLGTRSGLGASVGVKAPIVRGGFKSELRADYSFTTRNYNRTVLALRGHPASLEYGYEWRPQEQFYGRGLESSQDLQSNFAIQREFVRGSLHWAWSREEDIETSPPHAKLDLWTGLRTQVTLNGREEGLASYQTFFPEEGARTLGRRFDHVVSGSSFESDWLLGQQRWTRGWRVFFSGERYDPAGTYFALRSARPEGARFERYVVETETGFSFLRDPRTLRFFARLMNQTITGGRDQMMLEDMATLGSRDGLRGYPAGRFTDLDQLLGRINYVFPLVRRLEMDLHSEWGGVYGNFSEDAKLSTLRHSWGFAFRGRLKDRPIGAIGLDFSREATRLRLSVGGVR